MRNKTTNKGPALLQCGAYTQRSADGTVGYDMLHDAFCIEVLRGVIFVAISKIKDAPGRSARYLVWR